MTAVARLAAFEDFRAAARKRLPHILFDYIDGGSYGEVTLRRNEAAFAELTLDQRVMCDVSAVSTEARFFDLPMSAPLALAPVGFAGMFARRGEVQAARAARAAGLPFCLSTVGICSIEEVVAGAGAAPWFQLYMIRDRGWMRELLQRAQGAGCPVLVLTADLQTPGARYRDQRSGMARAPELRDHFRRGIEAMTKTAWLRDVWLRGRPHTFGNLDGVLPAAASFHEAWRWIAENFDPSVTWRDLDFIRAHWSGPILLKGIMTQEDAGLALQHGVNGIVVSNHGGRQLDSAPASISQVPGIRERVGPEFPVFVDGGIRSGLDVLKALLEGADAALLGRPWAFALAAGGRAGVEKLLATTVQELRTAQTLAAVARAFPRPAR
jgi:L-lactate dehydrogenase (cytochrome)